MISVTRRNIEEVIKKHPLLNNHGYGLGDLAINECRTRAERNALHTREQQALLDNVEQVARARRWWSTKAKTKTTKSQRYDSYALKHIAEPEIGYTTNGAFIAAAILCGFDVRCIESPNVVFNLSSKSILAVGQCKP